MSDFLTRNNLIRGENRVYRKDGQGEEFQYSDGKSTERYLRDVFTSCDDLSSGSIELQEYIKDWPSEYHLDAKRSNVLRGFNLSGVERVLELGCGCGSITRYLAEQGIQVDAVEGSAVRADLARLRCEDMENARIINANYNDLDFHNHQDDGDSNEESAYDLILFIGVLEYARFFYPEATSDKAAVSAILQRSASLLSPNGALIVAIENRLGLKYVMGVHEDHYHQRYIGLYGYPDSQGMATYCSNEWRSLGKAGGFSVQRQFGIYPDYKLPTLLLAEDYCQQANYVENHLLNTLSRDYMHPLAKPLNEFPHWQAMAQGRSLHQHANSYCIVMAKSQQSIDKLAAIDFCHLSGAGRAKQFQARTVMYRGTNEVNKLPLLADLELRQQNGVTQHLESSPRLEGPLLVLQWLAVMQIKVDFREVEKILQQYHDYLVDHAERQGGLPMDLLPINIIVDEHGGYHVFDQEWQVDWPVTVEAVLFRALLQFILSYWHRIEGFLLWAELTTVHDFLVFGFRSCGLNLSAHLTQCIEDNDRFHHAVETHLKATDTASLLDQVFWFENASYGFTSSLKFAAANNLLDAGGRIDFTATASPQSQTLLFRSFIDESQQLSVLQLSLFERKESSELGFFRIDGITLHVHSPATTSSLDTSQSKQSRGSEPLWQLQGHSNIAVHANANGAMLFGEDQDQHPQGWIANHAFPKLTFDLPQEIKLPSGSELVVSVDLIANVDDRYVYYRNAINAAKRQAHEIGGTVKQQRDELRAERDGLKQSLQEITNSTSYRLSLRLAYLVSRCRKLIKPKG